MQVEASKNPLTKADFEAHELLRGGEVSGDEVLPGIVQSLRDARFIIRKIFFFLCSFFLFSMLIISLGFSSLILFSLLMTNG